MQGAQAEIVEPACRVFATDRGGMKQPLTRSPLAIPTIRERRWAIVVED
ncbi:MAG: hypothetical protein ACRDG4_08795 [Chloroflexota bacterium]